MLLVSAMDMRKRLGALLSAAIVVSAMAFLMLASFGVASESVFAEAEQAPTQMMVNSIDVLPDSAKLIALGSALLGLAGAMRRFS
jgi:hypothetical protein